MNWLIDVLSSMGGFFRPHLADITLALVASVLVIAGNDINRYIKKQLSGANFIVRTTLFILICSFGYGAATVLLTHVLKTQLAVLSSWVLALVIIGGFLVLGIWAERKKHI